MKRISSVVSILLLVWIPLVFGHPMGNFSVSHYSHLSVSPDGARLEYILDLAEIPTFELLQQWNLTKDSPPGEVQRKAEQQARLWANHLFLRSKGALIVPKFEEADYLMSDGAANMPVLKIHSYFKLPVSAGELHFEDKNYPERAGWKELVITGQEGAQISASTATEQERSQKLTVYPPDPASAPPQELSASVAWKMPLAAASHPPLEEAVQSAASVPVVPTPASPAPSSAPPVREADKIMPGQPGAQGAGMVTRGDYLSKLMGSKQITGSMMLLGIVVAFWFGAAHALSPGHGKTMVAAYLVGSRGTARHAAILGLTVTITHTISVFALGFVTLFLSKYILPDQLYPVLGAISGLTIVWIGGSMFLRRARKLRGAGEIHTAHAHHHSHEYVHAHDGHGHHYHRGDHDHDHGDHDHGPNGHTHLPAGDINMGSLIALGASGGLVPCPSGLVLLLSSIAIGRVDLGILFLTAFSAGLAIVLMAVGILVVYAKNLLPDSQATARNPIFRYLPVASSAVVMVIGALMTCVSLGWIRPGALIG